MKNAIQNTHKAPVKWQLFCQDLLSLHQRDIQSPLQLPPLGGQIGRKPGIYTCRNRSLSALNWTTKSLRSCKFSSIAPSFTEIKKHTQKNNQSAIQNFSGTYETSTGHNCYFVSLCCSWCRRKQQHQYINKKHEQTGNQICGKGEGS